MHVAVLKQIARVALGRQVRIPITIRRPATRLGSSYGGWTLDVSALSASSVVFSCGVGEDISFDLDLIDRTGATVHAFDPTPKALDFIARQNLPPQFRFHAVAIGAYDGSLTLYPPQEQGWASWTHVRLSAGQSIEVPVRSIASVARELELKHLDVLKLDIEGAEYEALEALLMSDDRLSIDQILVEFHHRLPGIGREKTKTAIKQISAAGFGAYAVSDGGNEISFARK